MADTATASYDRALSDTEMAVIAAAIAAAGSAEELITATVRVLYGVLGAALPTGPDGAAPGTGPSPSRARFAIPEAQWLCIAQLCLARAEEFGAGVHAALALERVMPARYSDPRITVPPVPGKDHRPPVHRLTVTREASDVIGASSRHCDGLARYFGEDSPEHLDAVRSWQSALSRLFAMEFGARTRIEGAGDLSLDVVSETTGFVYGVHFRPSPPHPHPNPNPQTQSHPHPHRHDAPRPGRWESVF